MSEGNGRINRRQFLALTGLAAAGGVIAASSYVSAHNEVEQLVIEKISLPIDGLSPALEGFTIAVLADFHVYPFTSIELVREAVVKTNALKPDLTVLLGDYVWHEVEVIDELAPVLANLNAKYGVFAATGNHDYWTDINVISAAMKNAGLPLSKNEGVPIPAGNGALYLAILDDGWSGQPDLRATMGRHTPDTTTVLIAHEPDLADRYAADPRIQLQLSGHSHGGQIRFPGVGAIILPYLGWKYDMGLYQVSDMWLYTNRGLGVTNIPARLNCAPEITEITLFRA